MILARRLMSALLVAILLFGCRYADAQRVVEEWAPNPGYLRIGPEAERQVPLSEVGHVLLIPEERATG